MSRIISECSVWYSNSWSPTSATAVSMVFFKKRREPADAHHDALHLVVEVDVDPVVAPPRHVSVGPVGVGHVTRIVLRQLLVR